MQRQRDNRRRQRRDKRQRFAIRPQTAAPLAQRDSQINRRATTPPRRRESVRIIRPPPPLGDDGQPRPLERSRQAIRRLIAAMTAPARTGLKPRRRRRFIRRHARQHQHRRMFDFIGQRRPPPTPRRQRRRNIINRLKPTLDLVRIVTLPHPFQPPFPVNFPRQSPDGNQAQPIAKINPRALARR